MDPLYLVLAAAIATTCGLPVAPMEAACAYLHGPYMALAHGLSGRVLGALAGYIFGRVAHRTHNEAMHMTPWVLCALKMSPTPAPIVNGMCGASRVPLPQFIAVCIAHGAMYSAVACGIGGITQLP